MARRKPADLTWVDAINKLTSVMRFIFESPPAKEEIDAWLKRTRKARELRRRRSAAKSRKGVHQLRPVLSRQAGA